VQLQGNKSMKGYTLMKDFNRTERAYTLIEILIVLTVIGILFGAGFVGYRDFSRRQALAGVVKQLQGDLRLAQQMALSGEKPNTLGCVSNSLDGIRFEVTTSPPYIYRLKAACGSIVNYPLIKEFSFPSNISLDLTGFSPNPVLFKVLGQGTNIPSVGNAVITLTQAETGNKATVTITPGGSIK